MLNLRTMSQAIKPGNWFTTVDLKDLAWDSQSCVSMMRHCLWAQARSRGSVDSGGPGISLPSPGYGGGCCRMVPGSPQLFEEDRESKAILFAVFLTVYLLILLGNFLLITILAADTSLHTPMYLTICSLAIIDISLSTCTVPTMLAVFSSTTHTVSFSACFTQTYFFLALLTTESFILLLMSYDRYVAICHPLHHPARITISYVSLFVGLSVLLIPLFLILLSYVKILLSVLCMSSSGGRAKAVSTCSSHLLVLSVFYLTTAGVFTSYRITGTSVDMRVMGSAGRAKAMSTCSSHPLVISVFFLTSTEVYIYYRFPGTSADMRVMGSVIQNVFPALMNPIIYCLRTKEIRDSLVKTLKKSSIFPGSK
ncbi:olfactory receptor 2AT4-like [Amia ocellicauda]|uniref:olfactory receptor 2AT4-like n=1 Tax=Amia ocellicauda TaxID=2972642 RepID=UPI003464E2CE